MFTEGTLGVVVQTSLQTLKTEGVTARCGHRLVVESAQTGGKRVITNTSGKPKHTNIVKWKHF